MDAKKKATEYFQALNRRRIRRCQPYPGDREKIIDIISACIEQEKPIPILKGWSKAFDNSEEAQEISVRFMAGAIQPVADDYKPGLHINISYADVYVAFNGCPTNSTDDPARIHAMFREGFSAQPNVTMQMHLLSDTLGFTTTDGGRSFKEFDLLAERARTAEPMPERTAAKLSRQAEKYYRRTNDAPGFVAAMYNELAKMDVGPLGKAFPGHIYITNGSANSHNWVPEGLPALCMFSLTGGVSDKPWNVTDKELEGYKAIYSMAAQRTPPRAQPAVPKANVVAQPPPVNDTGAQAAGLKLRA